jgi:hypothetical protein
MSNVDLAIIRKAQRQAIKAALPPPTCKQCGAVIAGARRLAGPETWARLYCSSACKQEAWRDRHGE